MLKKMFARLARRKMETITVGVVAAVAAAGLLTQEDAASAGGVAARPVATYVTAAAVAHVPALVKTLAPVTRATDVNAGTRLATIDNPRVDSWIKRFTTDLRSSYATDLGRMERYSDMILGKLDDRGMPHELIFLAMIESGFNSHAKSSAKASGMWQFMSATARGFGLTVNRRVDQRIDPVKSTDAALTYLSQLKDRLGSWYLAAAAYNSGAGTVTRALRKVTGKTTGTDADFYRILSKLPKETRDYVPKLIAAARIGANPERYGFAAN
jgi:soluble lytic murein transglycosylase-like protein